MAKRSRAGRSQQDNLDLLDGQTSTPTADRPTKRASRRSLIRLGGAAAAAAAVAAVAGRDGTAHAAPSLPDVPIGPGTGATTDGFAVVAGVGNTSVNTTFVAGGANADPVFFVDGFGTATTGAKGFTSVSPLTNGSIAVAGFGTGTGVYGDDSFTGTGIGVFGQTSNGAAVFGNALQFGDAGSFFSEFGDALHTNGGTYEVNMFGSGIVWWLASGVGHPSSGFHNAGEMYVDSKGQTWVCTASGTAGTWVRLGGVADGAVGGGISFLPGIVRVVGGGTPPGVLIAASGTATFPIAGVGGIPANATGVLGTVTCYGSSGTGFVSMFPAGTGASGGTMNYLASDEPLSCFAMSGLGTTAGNVGKVTVACFVSSVKFILDAVGYTV
jgi:hypothetical protein